MHRPTSPTPTRPHSAALPTLATATSRPPADRDPRGYAGGRTVLALAVLAVLAGAFPALLSAQSSSFGNAVAVADGEMIIGEPNNNFRPGMVYVYRRDAADGSWREVGTLTAPDAERADGFGAALALDGATLLVAQRGGRIHEFRKEGGEWRFSGTPVDGVVTGIDPGCNAYGYCGTDFGLALALEGDRLLVGDAGVPVTPERRRRGRDETGEAPPAGAVHAFHRDASGAWSRVQTFEAPESAPADAFGAAVILVGGRALVGAPRAAAPAAAEVPGEGAASEGAEPGGETVVEGAGRAFAYRLEDGRWQLDGELSGPGEDGATFGAAIDVSDGRAVVGAPGAAGGRGSAFLFRSGTDGWTRTGRLEAPDGMEDDRFGRAVAFAGQDVWVGAPVERGIETGKALVFRGAADGGSDGDPRVIRFTEDETNTEDGLGLRLATGEGVVAVTAGGLDHGAGGVFVYERRDGAAAAWESNGLLVSPPDALTPVVDGERRCSGEAVGGLFDCEGIDLLSFVSTTLLKAPGENRGVRTNDNWGWTDPETGREYALVGRNDGTSFVDITDPARPVLVGDLPKTPETPRSQLWRDIKTYRDHAFIVADGAGRHGMQVFDLTRLRDVTDPPAVFEPDVLYRGEGTNAVESIHNIIINRESGHAYLTSRECSGMHIVDVRDPTDPSFVACADEGSTHDAQCVTYEGPDAEYGGREICFRMSGDHFQISDVTDKTAARELATATHPNPAYMHQGWLTEDHRYFVMDDESDVIAGNVDRTRTLIWDVADLEDPQLAHEFMGSFPASAHNLYVKGDLAYQANYRYGLHILDIADPLAPREVGFFDTSPHHSGPGFSGAWSTYPFFDSGSVIVTSMQEGLFVLQKRERPIS